MSDVSCLPVRPDGDSRIPKLEIGLLGPLLVRVGGAQVTVPRGRVSAVIADLALHAGRTLSIERLLEDIYGEDFPRRPRNAVYVAITRARKVLGAGRLTRQSTGYRLEASGLEVDADRFTREVSEARQLRSGGQEMDAYTGLRRALALYRGPVLEGLADYPFGPVEAARLEQARLRATEVEMDLAIELGQLDDAVTQLTALTSRHQTSERFWFQLVLALHRGGRRAEALSAYADARRALVQELGVEPGTALRNLHAVVLRATAPSDEEGNNPFATARRTRRGGNVPADLTEFVGRHGESRRLAALLRRRRLVTLTGPGGTGKSRLARQVAAAAEGTDGPWWVDLTPLRERTGSSRGAGQVARQVARALDVSAALEPGEPGPDMERHVIERLRQTETLLVLDNCEHVLHSVTVFTERLIAAAPGVRVLCTTREALGVPGEEILALPPLEVPPARLPEGGRLEDYESCQLFLARLPQLVTDPHTDAVTVRAILEICRVLDGIPLALELAAARIAVLTPVELARQLGERLDLLRSDHRSGLAHHQTLRAAVEWSTDHLDALEWRVLREMSLYPAGLSLQAAGAQFPDLSAASLVDVLAQLWRKSLIVPEAGPASSRYRQLNTIQVHALQALEASPALAQAAQRQHGWAVSFAAEHGTGVLGPRLREARLALGAEHPNLAAVIARAPREGYAGDGLRLASDLAWYWRQSGLDHLGYDLLTALLDDPAVPQISRAHGHQWAAHLAWATHQHERAVYHASRALALDAVPTDRALALTYGGLASKHLRRPGAARMIEEAVRAAAATGDESTLAACLLGSGIAHMTDGNLGTAEEQLHDSLRHYQATDNHWHQLRVLLRLILIAEARGNPAHASRLADRLAQRSAELDLSGLKQLAWAHRARIAAAHRDPRAGEFLDRLAPVPALRPDSETTAIADHARALKALRDGDHTRARTHARAALGFYLRAGQPQQTVQVLTVLFQATADPATRASLAADCLEQTDHTDDPHTIALALDAALATRPYRAVPVLAASTHAALTALRTNTPHPPWPQLPERKQQLAHPAVPVAATALTELARTWRAILRPPHSKQLLSHEDYHHSQPAEEASATPVHTPPTVVKET
ncbi:BTAD domain-containing putative transcriptional regulator [Streptomyces sp. NPDC098789]|uniref:BTAD domain-containing putative transcriptional regulator n=1 Tax=Streptomyces sp. NPDC098789 TaxID=3366098 RepID=UPI003811EA44